MKIVFHKGLTMERWGEETANFFKEFLRFRECIAEFYLNPPSEVAPLEQLVRLFFDLKASVHNLGIEF